MRSLLAQCWTSPGRRVSLIHTGGLSWSVHAPILLCRKVRTGQKNCACPVVATQKTLSYGVDNTRRGILLGGLAFLCTGIVTSPLQALAHVLKSQACDTPCVLVLENNATKRSLKAFWINYDGDPELFATIPPGGTFTVDTFETHPWRLVDAETGATVQELVARSGEQIVRVSDSQFAAKLDSPVPQEVPTFTGFDGIGGNHSDYGAAELTALAIDTGGGVATLAFDVDGVDVPFAIVVGLPEALAIIHTTAANARRPSTVGAWDSTLQAVGFSVERVLITRLVGSTYYARIVLLGPAGERRSVDARPSDSIALALQAKSPVYVARSLAIEAAKAQQGDDLEEIIERLKIKGKDQEGYLQTVEA